MTQQMKKKLSSLLIVCATFTVLLGCSANAQTNETESTEISQVAEQKSVIDEQAMMLPLGGVSLALDNSESLTLSKVASEQEQVTATEEEVIYNNGWTNASVNVRKEPNTDSEVLATLKYNTVVSYVKTTNEWSQVQYNNEIAYIKTEYISETENPSLSPYVELIDSLTEDEKHLIYQIDFAEAGNQTMDGQRAVIEVILNRVLSDEFPNTVKGVLSQSGQFSTWRLRNSVTHNEQQEEALRLVYTEAPVLNTNYIMFSVGKNLYGRNYVKIDDQWFGTF